MGLQALHQGHEPLGLTDVDHPEGLPAQHPHAHLSRGVFVGEHVQEHGPRPRRAKHPPQQLGVDRLGVAVGQLPEPGLKHVLVFFGEQPRPPVEHVPQRLERDGVPAAQAPEEGQHPHDVRLLGGVQGLGIVLGVAHDGAPGEQHQRPGDVVLLHPGAVQLKHEELLEERDDGGGVVVVLGLGRGVTFVLQVEHPVMFAVPVAMKAGVTVVDEHRPGVMIEHLRGLRGLLKGGGVLHHQALLAQRLADLPPLAIGARRAPVALVHEHEVSALKHLRGHRRRPGGAARRGELVDAQPQDGVLAVDHPVKELALHEGAHGHPEPLGLGDVLLDEAAVRREQDDPLGRLQLDGLGAPLQVLLGVAPGVQERLQPVGVQHQGLA